MPELSAVLISMTASHTAQTEYAAPGLPLVANPRYPRPLSLALRKDIFLTQMIARSFIYVWGQRPRITLVPQTMCTAMRRMLAFVGLSALIALSSTVLTRL
jgi:hypothetical protein